MKFNIISTVRTVVASLLITLGVLTASAQDIRVTGHVYFLPDNEPAMGACVGVRDNDSRIFATDMEGYYSVTVSPKATLLFQYAGYETQAVPVLNRANIDVYLREVGSGQHLIEISGIVYDNNGNEAIGAIVKVKDAPDTSTVTDANGQYTITAPADAVLLVSYLKTRNFQVAVHGRRTINVQLTKH